MTVQSDVRRGLVAAGLEDLVTRAWFCTSRRGCLPLLLQATCFLLINVSRAPAVGWDSDDFIIGGGTNQGGKVGVFNADLTFKGYLENPSAYGFEDFDANGRLVGIEGSNELRLYDPSGAYAGGFYRADDALKGGVGLRVARNGDYIVPERPNYGFGGVLEFQPDGTLINQYGSGTRASSLVVVPENRAWVWFPSDGASVVRVIDLSTFEQIGTVSLPNVAPQNMRYCPSTNTVLMASVFANGVVETDLAGQVVRQFILPNNVFAIGTVTRGANGDVLATSSDSTRLIVRWHGDGTLVGTVSVSQTIGEPGAIIWAGDVPEPTGSLLMSCAAVALCRNAGRPLKRRRSIPRSSNVVTSSWRFGSNRRNELTH